MKNWYSNLVNRIVFLFVFFYALFSFDAHKQLVNFDGKDVMWALIILAGLIGVCVNSVADNTKE